MLEKYYLLINYFVYVSPQYIILHLDILVLTIIPPLFNMYSLLLMIDFGYRPQRPLKFCQ